MESETERLTTIPAAIAWEYRPVINLTHNDALPPAARERGLKQAADTFASTGRNVFVHYVTPILEERRKRLLASGLRKKKYPKTAAQLWQVISLEENFYWNEAARELRQSMKQAALSPKGCLIHGGRLCERSTYVWHAEVAVAAYLEISPPIENHAGSKDDILNRSDQKVEEEMLQTELIRINGDVAKVRHAVPASTNNEQTTLDTNLLDTLPDRFEYEPKMLYSHFAHYDYDSIRAAEGKHQTAMLRQLADLFDKTGKTLFYYYVVPRLCKQSYPLTAGETVTGQAADVWKLLKGAEKEKWCNASVSVKKKLGDGDLRGLDVLELGSLYGGVLILHELAESAVQSQRLLSKGDVSEET